MHIKTHIKQIKPSDTLVINQRSKMLSDAGKEIFRFGFGQSPFPVPELIQDALRANAHQKDYLPVQGLLTLRHNIATHTNHLLASDYHASQVFIGPGSKELIYLTQLALDLPLIIPSPSWVSYAPQAIMAQNKIYTIPCASGTWNLTAQDLEDTLIYNKLHGGLLILNYPNNPTGQQLDDLTLASIAFIAKKYALIIISDEIYGLLDFNHQYQSIARYYPEGTIISSGISKWCGAGGWRLGYFIIPTTLSKLYKTLVSLASETFSAVSAPIQYAAVFAYSGHPLLEQYRLDCITILQHIASYTWSRLTQMNIAVAAAAGGFYLMPDFSFYTDKLSLKGIKTSKALCEDLLEKTGVALLPGSAFGRPPGELTARLCFIDFDGTKALNHLATTGDLLKDDIYKLFPNMVKGLDQMEHYLNNELK
jgi:aspartate/methionine/tyrosine aminotransferase